MTNWTPRRHDQRLQHKAWERKPQPTQKPQELIRKLPAWEHTSPELWQLQNPNYPDDYTRILAWVERTPQGWVGYWNVPKDGKLEGAQVCFAKPHSIDARNWVDITLRCNGWTRS